MKLSPLVVLAIFYSLSISCTPRSDYRKEKDAFKKYEIGQFIIQVPSTWQPIDANRLNSLKVIEAFGFENVTNGDISYGENVFLRFSSHGQDKSPKQLADELISALQKQYGQVKLISVQDTVSNQINMRIVDYALLRQKPIMHSTAVFAKCDTITIQMEFLAVDPANREYAQVRSIFDGIITSLARR